MNISVKRAATQKVKKLLVKSDDHFNVYNAQMQKTKLFPSWGNT